MRLSSFLPLLGMAAVGLSAADAAKSKKADEADKPTVFDGIEVPPMINLTPKNFEEYLNSSRYLFVKHYR